MPHSVRMPRCIYLPGLWIRVGFTRIRPYFENMFQDPVSFQTPDSDPTKTPKAGRNWIRISNTNNSTLKCPKNNYRRSYGTSNPIGWGPVKLARRIFLNGFIFKLNFLKSLKICLVVLLPTLHHVQEQKW